MQKGKNLLVLNVDAYFKPMNEIMNFGILMEIGHIVLNVLFVKIILGVTIIYMLDNI